MMLLRPSAGKTTVDPSNAAVSGFSDVASGAYYSKAINWATANGIAYGKGNNLFDPDGTVTRAEAVTFLQRYLHGADGSSSKFTDVPSTAYYSGAVGWAVKISRLPGALISTENRCLKLMLSCFRVHPEGWY